jgi:hypothetical protein
MKMLPFVKHMYKTEGASLMSFTLNRINPNQTQVFFLDGRFETLTNEELQILLSERVDSEAGQIDTSYYG